MEAMLPGIRFYVFLPDDNYYAGAHRNQWDGGKS